LVNVEQFEWSLPVEFARAGIVVILTRLMQGREPSDLPATPNMKGNCHANEMRSFPLMLDNALDLVLCSTLANQ
jgi:hypothetical protein